MLPRSPQEVQNQQPFPLTQAVITVGVTCQFLISQTPFSLPELIKLAQVSFSHSKDQCQELTQFFSSTAQSKNYPPKKSEHFRSVVVPGYVYGIAWLIIPLYLV
uniref:Uncharacterized protein n=1 Tax=Sphaerodactylus townsendi TaxID=933632 RepID=A0ACB8EVN6_9SAUR